MLLYMSSFILKKMSKIACLVMEALDIQEAPSSTLAEYTIYVSLQMNLDGVFSILSDYVISH